MKTPTVPSRFYDGQPVAAMRRELRAISNSSPSLPSGMARLGFTLQRERRPLGFIWACQIFDRAPAWIGPRYQKCYINENSRVCAADAACWMEDRLPELRLSSLDVYQHSVNVLPYTAKV